MIFNFFLSLIIFPILWQHHSNSNGFLVLAPSVQQELVPDRIYTDVLDVKITAKSAIAVDAKSGQILYQKNPEEILPIASITKLMTALVFLDHNPGWQKEFFTIASDRRNGGTIYLNTGEVLTIRNLFNTALIVSDNDSAMALARSTGLDETVFIAEMNKKAKDLGLVRTTFFDPTGLNSDNTSTASEVAILLNYALTREPIQSATSTAYYEYEVTNKEHQRTVKLRNTDWLLRSYLNILGGKTGSLEEAGNCLAVKIKGEQGQEILVVVLGSQTNSDRFQDVKAITDWVFTNYQWKK
jgi:D-alanyl-D-alanine carboxypeptidase